MPVKQVGNGEGCAGNAKMNSGSLEGFRWSLFPYFLSSCILKTFHSKEAGQGCRGPSTGLHGGLESRPRSGAVAAAELLGNSLLVLAESWSHSTPRVSEPLILTFWAFSVKISRFPAWFPIPHRGWKEKRRN